MAFRHRLNSAFIKTAPAGKHCDGGGLWLIKRNDGGSQWTFRYQFDGRRKEIGLGGLLKVGLKDARTQADHYRALVLSKNDPLREKAKMEQESYKIHTTVTEIAHAAFEARKAELKGDGKNGRWFSPLELHVLPKIGHIRIEDLTQRDVAAAVKPIWDSKAETAKKGLDRLNIVIKYAAALGLDADIGVVEKAKLLLGKSRHERQHIPYMLWSDVPAFYRSLSEPTITHLALRLLILTGSRSKPIRFARLEHFVTGDWIIPADLNKGKKGETSDFAIPLSLEAQNVLEQTIPFQKNGFLFPSSTKNEVISDATMSRYMERLGLAARPHGFRSSIRTWLSEQTEAPFHISETIIGHKVRTDTQLSYDRTDFIEQRKPYMQGWADFLMEG
jgi:integrase